MEVLYYFICSVKDNVPFILSNRANEIIQYLHNKWYQYLMEIFFLKVPLEHS